MTDNDNDTNVPGLADAKVKIVQYSDDILFLSPKVTVIRQKVPKNHAWSNTISKMDIPSAEEEILMVFEYEHDTDKTYSDPSGLVRTSIIMEKQELIKILFQHLTEEEIKTFPLEYLLATASPTIHYGNFPKRVHEVLVLTQNIIPQGEAAIKMYVDV